MYICRIGARERSPLSWSNVFVLGRPATHFLHGRFLLEVTMKGIRIHQYGDASTLKLEEIPRLSIPDDQLLVRIREAGVNPIDWKIRQGYMKQVRPADFPITMGQDFAGEVVEAGKNVKQFASGDRVFGFAQGTYAEYAAAPASTVAAISRHPGFHHSSSAAYGRVDRITDYS